MKVSKSLVCILALAVFAVVMSASHASAELELSDCKTELAASKAALSEYDKKRESLIFALKLHDRSVTALENKAEEYEDFFREYGKEIIIFNKLVCLVSETGEKYHHYGCYHIEDSLSVYFLTTWIAEDIGYTYCKDCWNQGLIDELPSPNSLEISSAVDMVNEYLTP